jgi:hypothetical protein
MNVFHIGEMVGGPRSWSSCVCNCTENIPSNGTITINYELGGIGKEVVVAYLEIVTNKGTV